MNIIRIIVNIFIMIIVSIKTRVTRDQELSLIECAML